MVPALVWVAALPTRSPEESASAGSWPSGRPQRATCSLSWRKSSVRKPAAVSTKIHQETPPPTRLTGML